MIRCKQSMRIASFVFYSLLSHLRAISNLGNDRSQAWAIWDLKRKVLRGWHTTAQALCKVSQHAKQLI